MLVGGLPDGANPRLFAGTAWYYARFRPGYPDVFFADLIARFHLDGTQRLLDLGCGTGQLILPLAAHVAEAVGIDPEPAMLAEAANQAQASQITNVTWVQGSSQHLASDLGRFDLVTMGRSFHWMDREQVLTALNAVVDDRGGLVIANDSCLVRPSPPWQRALEDIQQRYLPPDWQAGVPTVAGGPEPHEDVLARSAFSRVEHRTYEFTSSWTVEQAIGYLYSTSLPLRRLLGGRRSAFELEVTDALRAIEPAGRYDEPVTLHVLIATKR